MRVDVKHCLSTPASKARCVVLDQREEMMRVATVNDEAAPGARLDPRPQCAGRSLLQMMEDRLDQVVWDIMVLNAQAPAVATMDKALLAGEASGIAQCIAFVRTPYAPDVGAVKAASMDRYQRRLAALAAGSVG